MTWLVVEKLSAEGLPKMDLLGSADPYVVMTIGGESARTRYIHNSRSPSWKGEEFVLPLPKDHESLFLVFNLWDRDHGKSDDYIGMAQLSMDKVSSETKDFSLSIHKSGDGEVTEKRGKLRFTALLEDEESDVGEDVEEKVEGFVKPELAQKLNRVLSEHHFVGSYKLGLHVQCRKVGTVKTWKRRVVVITSSSVVLIGQSRLRVYIKRSFHVSDLKEIDASKTNELTLRYDFQGKAKDMRIKTTLVNHLVRAIQTSLKALYFGALPASPIWATPSTKLYAMRHRLKTPVPIPSDDGGMRRVLQAWEDKYMQHLPEECLARVEQWVATYHRAFVVDVMLQEMRMKGGVSNGVLQTFLKSLRFNAFFNQLIIQESYRAKYKDEDEHKRVEWKKLVSHIQEVVSSNPYLHTFALSVGLSSSDISKIFKKGLASKQLSVLDLNGNSLEDDTFEIVAKAIEACAPPHLAELDLSVSKSSPSAESLGFERFVRALSKHCRRLRELSLGGVFGQFPSVRALENFTKVLCKWKYLQKLDVSRCDLPEDHLVDLLKECKSLDFLNILNISYNNSLNNPTAMTALRDLLDFSQHVNRLDISGCELTEKRFMDLATTLSEVIRPRVSLFRPEDAVVLKPESPHQQDGKKQSIWNRISLLKKPSTGDVVGGATGSSPPSSSSTRSVGSTKFLPAESGPGEAQANKEAAGVSAEKERKRSMFGVVNEAFSTGNDNFRRVFHLVARDYDLPLGVAVNVLNKCPFLVTFDVSKWVYRDFTLEHVTKLVQAAPGSSLKVLRMGELFPSWNAHAVEAWSGLLPPIEQNDPRIAIAQAVGESILGAAKSNVNALSLYGDGKHTTMGPPLAMTVSALAMNQTLTRLDVSNNLAGCHLGISLGLALRQNRSLTALNFDGNKMRVDGLKGFRGCLYGNRKIVDLTFPTNDLVWYIDTTCSNIISLSKEEFKQRASYRSTKSSAHKDAFIAAIRLRKKLERDLVKVQKTMSEIRDAIDRNNGAEFEKAKRKVERELKKDMSRMQRKAERVHKKFTRQRSRLLRQLVTAVRAQMFNLKENLGPELDETSVNKLVKWIGHTPKDEADEKTETELLLGLDKLMALAEKDFHVADFLGRKLVEDCTKFVDSLKLQHRTRKRTAQTNGAVSLERPAATRAFSKYEYQRPNRSAHRRYRRNDADESDYIVVYPYTHPYHTTNISGRGKDDMFDADEDMAVIEDREEEKIGDEWAYDEDEIDPFEWEEDLATDADLDDDMDLDLVGMYGAAGPSTLRPFKDDDAPAPRIASEKQTAFVRSGLDTFSLTHAPQEWGDGEGALDQLLSVPKMRLRILSGMAATLGVDKLPSVDVNFGSSFISSLPRSDRDITIVTQCTTSRLPQLRQMAASWSGVISVAVFSNTFATAEDFSECVEELRQVHETVESRGECRLDIFVVTWQEEEDGPAAEACKERLYPINAMRNIALSQAKTDMVLLLDIDFVPARGLHKLLSTPTSYSWIHNQCNDAAKPTAFILPAFEALETVGTASSDHDHVHSITVPNLYSQLMRALGEGKAEPFHVKNFPQGHGATQFERWADVNKALAKVGIDTDNIDEVDDETRLESMIARLSSCVYKADYVEGFEPYVIVSRHRCPQYDERFVGYGMNKISHLYRLNHEGHTFKVLPAPAFVVAAPHAVSPSWKKTFGANADCQHRIRIRQLFNIMKEELYWTAAEGSTCSEHQLQYDVAGPDYLHRHVPHGI